MRTMSPHKAMNESGLMIDATRTSPVMIDNHGRSAVVVVAVKEYERLSEKPVVLRP